MPVTLWNGYFILKMGQEESVLCNQITWNKTHHLIPIIAFEVSQTITKTSDFEETKGTTKYEAQLWNDSWDLLLGDDGYSYVDMLTCQIRDECWLTFYSFVQAFLEQIYDLCILYIPTVYWWKILPFFSLAVYLEAKWMGSQRV